MNTNLIYNILSEASLYLDELVLMDIKSFIQTFLGDSWSANPKLYIYVCAAIVCECKRVPAIQSSINVPFGLTVQKILKCIPEIPKQQFLTTIIRMVQKWPTCPSQFTHKLQNLKLSFRVFKKYMVTCKSIGEKLALDPRNNYQMSALFWLIYLIAKNSHNQSDSLQVMTIVIPCLMFHIYTSYLMLGREQIVEEAITKFFSIPAQISHSMKEIQIKYEKQFRKILSESYTKRFLENPSNFNCLVHKPLYVQRLLDDLSNKYAEVVYNSPQFSIDQMSFLQIKKDITPLPFQEKIDKIGFIISEKLSFDSERPPNNQNTPKRPANYKVSIMNEQTPVTKRIQNLSWIRNCIQGLQQSKFQIVQTCYKQHNKENSFKEFLDKAFVKLDKIIQQFSPTYKDHQRRKSQIYKFFIYCMSIVIDSYKNQVQKIFKANLSIFTIFCLSTELFNFIYQTYSGDYSKYCQIFQVDSINAFWPINWFGFYINFPKSVLDHLFELERRFLLKQIWMTDLGYRIISNRQKMVPIVQLRMLQRMKQHIKWRVGQICQGNPISQRKISRINIMILHLIEKKPQLLKKNNIDQIAICSITACLSLHEQNNNLTLQKIFAFYQKISMSYLQNKDKLYDYQQNEMNIIDFYNNVFLNEVQQLLKKYPESSNMLLTPKRLQYTQKYKLGIQSTPLRQKLKQQDSVFCKKAIISSQNKSKLQLNLAKNIKIQQDALQMLDESEQSSQRNQKYQIQKKEKKKQREQKQKEQKQQKVNKEKKNQDQPKSQDKRL